MGDRQVAQWVSDSSVRSNLLSSVAETPVSTDTLIESQDASQSAVYASLNDLERRDLIEARNDEWIVTGRGQLVTDLLDQRRGMEQLLAGDTEYWQSHDIAVLPRRFRLRLGELEPYTVLRRTQTDPRRVIREVSSRIEDAAYARILAPIYTDEYATAMPDNSDSGLVLSQQVIDETLGETISDPDADPPEQTEIRIGAAPIGLTVLPDVVMVSFPTLEGQYDARSELIAESDRAREWGEDLFAYYWEQAMPIPDS